MDLYKKFEGVLRQKWITQSGNFLPLFIGTAAESGFLMKKDLGFGYTRFIFRYENGYGDMNYWTEDVDRLWNILDSKIRKDVDYLQKIKTLYENNFSRHEEYRSKSKGDLSVLPEADLIQLFKQGVFAQGDSVGVAHIIEPISFKMEDVLKKCLVEELGEDGYKRHISRLAAPSWQSFAAREEADLMKVKALPEEKREKALCDHQRRYEWVKNSYLGRDELTLVELKERMKSLFEEKEEEEVVVNKEEVIEKLRLGKKTRDMLRLVDFVAQWQDERKENTLSIIGALSLIADEVARRVKLKPGLVYNFTGMDVRELRFLSDVVGREKELEERAHGAYVILEKDNNYVVSGNLYKELREKQLKIEAGGHLVSKDIRGTIANGGTVVGKVAVCESVKLLDKVKKGDVLVTGMTRPEYMPALRRAAAIVTDEGGITSHAAVVARELNIPAVIGTKVATKVLKDGDMVEVRANHGVVKILKS